MPIASLGEAAVVRAVGPVKVEFAGVAKST